MDTQIVALVQSAIDAVKPVLPQILVGTAGSATWDTQKAIWRWIKTKVSGAGNSEVIDQIEKNVEKESKWGILSASLVDLIDEEPSLVAELSSLVGDMRSSNSQVVTGTGPGSKINQVNGVGNTTLVN